MVEFLDGASVVLPRVGEGSRGTRRQGELNILTYDLRLIVARLLLIGNVKMK